jgi:hypothetical protein
VRLVVVAAFAVGSAPAAAAAATRYATPSPAAGADCSSPGSACSITTAVNGAASGDTIIVGEGTYGSPSAPVAGPLNGAGITGLKIEAAAGGSSRPVLNLAGGFPSNASLQPTAVLLDGPAASLTDVDVEVADGSSDAVEITGGDASTLVDRVIARTNGGNACDLEGTGSAKIANSLCVTTAPAGDGADGIDIARGSGTLDAVNDTAISTGGYGLDGFETTGSPALLATNTIAQGGQDDVLSDQSEVTVDDCAYQTAGTNFGGTITDAGGRVDAAPVYVNAPSDLHEAASSPTIGAGTLSVVSAGETDLDGLPRVTGGQVDIGAYQLQPPTAALAAGVAVAGQPVSFSSAGSSAYDGLTIAGYSWNFGDGGIATNSSPTHTFARAGTYTVSLTVTDSRGAAATASKQLTVTAAPTTTSTPPSPTPPAATPRLSRFRIRPHRFEASPKGKAIVARIENGATISYRDTVTAHTTFRVYSEVPGVERGRRCVAPGRGAHGRGVKRCTRLVFVGSFKHHDRKGTNRLHFTGRIGGHALPPGNYTLKATATLDGQTSRPVSASFKILVPPPTCNDPDHDGDCDVPGQI